MAYLPSVGRCRSFFGGEDCRSPRLPEPAKLRSVDAMGAVCRLALTALCLASLASVSVHAGHAVNITVDLSATHDVSDKLYGIFFEEVWPTILCQALSNHAPYEINVADADADVLVAGLFGSAVKNRP